MWYDRDIDAVMARTKGRPIPAGRVNADEALAFGVVLSIGSVVVMGLAVNWLAAGLLALTIGYYVFLYTMWLKRRTPQNIVVGGAAGAFPPMIGWAAATGEVSIESLVLFAIIFMWTPPHFWVSRGRFTAVSPRFWAGSFYWVPCVSGATTRRGTAANCSAFPSSICSRFSPCCWWIAASPSCERRGA